MCTTISIKCNRILVKGNVNAIFNYKVTKADLFVELGKMIKGNC